MGVLGRWSEKFQKYAVWGMPWGSTGCKHARHASVSLARGSGTKKGGKRVVLFVALLSPRAGNTFQEGVARRLQWDYPEGANVVAEYWLETEKPRVIAVMEAQSMDAFGQIRMDWGDMFEIEVFPAVTAEQGMEMARQAMSGQAASGQG
jgi:hypothetical protein